MGNTDLTKSVQVKRVDGRLHVTFDLSDAQARRLAHILAEAADLPGCNNKEALRWRRMSRALKSLLNTMQRRALYQPRVKRPPDSCSNAEDRDQVVNGYPPYPVLSNADVLRVLPLLDKKRLEDRLVADRLHVNVRSVYRLRRKMRTEGDKVG